MRKIKQNKFKIVILALITIFGFYAFLHLYSAPLHQTSADNRDIVVIGGELGIDYTYDNGILRFINDGAYTLSMRDGITETSNQIEIDHNADMQNINLTLDNLNLNSDGANFAIRHNTSSSGNYFNINFILKGNNIFKANSTTYSSTDTVANLKISALNSNDTISFIAKNNEGSINNQSFILESGKVITQKTNITTMHGPIQINGGELNVDSTESSGALYTNDSFVMNNGKVNINTTGSTCVFATGFLLEDKDGIKILGGDFNCNATGTGKGAITAGNSANRFSSRNVIIDTTGTVNINHKYIGIALLKDSKLAINNGTIKINGGILGVYTGDTSYDNKITVNGGETEILASNNAVRINNSDKYISFGANYIHKNYDGENAESRQHQPDDNELTGEDGRSTKYVLITPAWPITYDLDGGTLAEDQSNPELYSRVDSFNLNNPTKTGYDFTGWTGTGLDQATTEVNIPEGSNGARNYKAEWYDPTPKDDDDKDDKGDKKKDDNDYRVLPAKDDNDKGVNSPNTQDTNPMFYAAIIGGSILILVGAFLQSKELIKR